MRRTAFALTVGVCALVALDATAKVKIINAPPQTAQPAPAAKNADALAGAQWVATKAIIRDAKTGKLRKPTAAETRELVRTLQELTARPATGQRRVISANGRVQATAEPAAPQVLVARATADGQNETLCVQTFDEAANFLGLQRVDNE